MKKIKIKSLELHNFKGVRNFRLNADGKSQSILGDNGTGKTTLFDAFLWLLFDKDSQGKSGFEVKTIVDGSPLHKLNHEVTGTLEIDGTPTVLRKVYSEKWTKKRGSATSEFTGHTVDYYVNDVPVKLKKYKEHVEQIADENIFKLLTSPTYFNEQLHWQDRRKTLLDICGDISDDDVIASNKELDDLPLILNGRKIEDHRKIVAGKRKEINDELQKIPVRIDEVNRSIPDVGIIDINKEKATIEALDTRIKKGKEILLRIESGGAVAEKENELRSIESQMLDIEIKHRREAQDAIDDKNKDKRSTSGKIADIDLAIARATNTIDDNTKKINTLNVDRERLREEFRQEESKKFEYEYAQICPLCEQRIPEEKINTAHDKAEEEFNITRSNSLDHIQTAGRAARDEVAKLEKENASLRSEVDAHKKKTIKLDLDLSSTKKTIASLDGKFNSCQGDPEYTELSTKHAAISQEITDLKNGQAPKLGETKIKLSDLEKERVEAQRKIDKHDIAKEGYARIEHLKQQEKILAAEFEKLERELYLTEQFLQTQAGFINNRVNDKFKLARFKLFSEQINGGLSPACETLYDGIPYSTGLNHGGQISVGLDIINTLSDHYGVSLPIFVDNSESITCLPEVNSQLIKLIVSEQDKVLRIKED